MKEGNSIGKICANSLHFICKAHMRIVEPVLVYLLINTNLMSALHHFPHLMSCGIIAASVTKIAYTLGEVPTPRMVGLKSEAGASPALSRNCKAYRIWLCVGMPSQDDCLP
jgi:hypothetical protein